MIEETEAFSRPPVSRDATHNAGIRTLLDVRAAMRRRAYELLGVYIRGLEQRPGRLIRCDYCAQARTTPVQIANVLLHAFSMANRGTITVAEVQACLGSPDERGRTYATGELAIQIGRTWYDMSMRETWNEIWDECLELSPQERLDAVRDGQRYIETLELDMLVRDQQGELPRLFDGLAAPYLYDRDENEMVTAYRALISTESWT
jgi:hypothetical protein